MSVVGLQWGDEGKGKVVDYLAGDFDSVARFNGGSNAGHTVVIGSTKRTFHLVPSGALKEKQLLIGPGVAVDPEVLEEEISLLPQGARERITVDGRCTLVSPADKDLDRVLEERRGEAAIGTTRRGIGPAYALRALRLSPRASDLAGGFDFKASEGFYRSLGADPSGLTAWGERSAGLLRDLLGNVSTKIIESVERGGSVLFETSQGTLLDLIHGTYPYVTSTHTTSSYIPAALGIPPSMAGEPLGVMKCYATRVGGGPFPTEEQSEVGDSIRTIGKEFGATTGRPRRVGWLDLVALRYAVMLNGAKKVVVSKLDVLSQVKEFKVCTAYKLDGTETTDFQEALPHLGEAEPIYESPLALYGASYESGLPSPAKEFVKLLESHLGVQVVMVSHGDERSKTIEL